MGLIVGGQLSTLQRWELFMLFDFAWLNGMIFSFRVDGVMFDHTTGTEDSSTEKQKVTPLVINVNCGSDPLWILKLNLRPLLESPSLCSSHELASLTLSQGGKVTSISEATHLSTASPEGLRVGHSQHTDHYWNWAKTKQTQRIRNPSFDFWSRWKHR